MMFPTHLHGALAQIFALGAGSELERAVRARWRDAGRGGAPSSQLPKHLQSAADELAEVLPALTRSDDGIADLCELLVEPGGEVLFSWCAASTWRRDVRLAPLLATALRSEFRDQALEVVRSRVVEGPLLEALACAPLLGDGAQLALPINTEARARLEILIWEAGARALEIPALGAWIWGAMSTFDELVWRPAHGALRGRVLAARCLEIAANGMPPSIDPRLVGRTLQVLQPLLLHPEPLVWIHAARALGRLTGEVEQLEGTLLDWVLSDTQILRQRAITAFASLPAKRLKFLGNQLSPMLESPDEDPWVIAAIAAATPYLFFDRRDLWDRLASLVLAGSGRAVSARALARGLAALWRRGLRDPDIEGPLRTLREQARSARPESLEDARRWLDVLAITDPIDLAERDPLDIELGLDNLMRVAAEYDDQEADARAARLAASLAPALQEARRIALGPGKLRHRAAAMNALEACARAFALRLWTPLLATHPDADETEEPDLQATWTVVASTPAEILDIVRERRQGGSTDAEADLRLEVLALRLGGYALDACGKGTQLGPGRGPTAHDTCLWLRKLEGLADGSRELPPPLRSALSALFWRLVDTTRGTALGEVDDVAWLGPFAAWWALVIDRPAMLLQLATALPMMEKGALSACCERAETLRTLVASGAVDGAWGEQTAEALASLHADDTELSYALSRLADALAAFGAAAGHKPNLEALCTELVLAGEELHGALADPVQGLREIKFDNAPDTSALSFGLDDGEDGDLAGLLDFGESAPPEKPRPGSAAGAAGAAGGAGASGAEDVASAGPSEPPPAPDPAARAAAENAPRVATLVARAVQARQLALLDVWFASLGPVASALLEAAIDGAIRRTRPPPPQPKKAEPKFIEGYELVKALGEGGIGSVWLVRKADADRFFVLKIPKADALANADEVEREGILVSFVEEAKALAGLYHPNVANIIDRGVSDGAPFLVLEYLIGADLKQYATARLMTLFELRQVVLESCAGLAALHSAGLVHRDIKPANLWLRLPLAGGQRFDPAQHRDPGHTPPLATVVIDFGMVRAIRIAPDAGGRFVAGTPGYIAPEQVLDPVELDPRADVYSLAASIYNVTTGRAFFDDIENPRDRIIAHMRRDPFDDAERLRGFPTAVARLLRAATTRNPADRPWPLQFGREFAASL
jgi:eukaryotic-like serine/threonine-protein kinase